MLCELFSTCSSKGKKKREKKKSCFADLFLDGWRRPSGVSILDCTLSKRWVSFLFSFFLSFFPNLYLQGKEEGEAFLFCLVPLLCVVYKRKEGRGARGGPPCPIQQSCRRWQQPKKEGRGGTRHIYVYIFFVCVPTDSPNRPSAHQQDPFCVCVCVPVGKLEAISP